MSWRETFQGINSGSNVHVHLYCSDQTHETSLLHITSLPMALFYITLDID